MNFINLPSIINEFILLAIKELLREGARRGLSCVELLDEAEQQTAINDANLNDLIARLKQ